MNFDFVAVENLLIESGPDFEKIRLTIRGFFQGFKIWVFPKIGVHPNHPF